MAPQDKSQKGKKTRSALSTYECIISMLTYARRCGDCMYLPFLQRTDN